MSKPTAKTSAGSIEDVKKIIEDEIAETLNLASVDPNEIVVFQDRQGKLKSSNVSLDDILIQQSDAAENSIALYSSGGRLKPGALVSTITDAIATHDNKIAAHDNMITTQNNMITTHGRELDDHIRGYNSFRKNVIHKLFGTPLVVGMTLAEIKNYLSLFFFNKDAGRMMNENEIKANYLEISKLIENLEKVQKPTNDVVVKFFGNPLVAGMTLAEINEFIGKHTHNAYIANSFFGVPATSTMTLKDINMFMVRQTTLNTIVDKFLGRTPVSETTSLTGPTLAEIKKAIDEQKLTSEIVNKFFEGSKPQYITTNFSNIDHHIKTQAKLRITS